MPCEVTVSTFNPGIPSASDTFLKALLHWILEALDCYQYSTSLYSPHFLKPVGPNEHPSIGDPCWIIVAPQLRFLYISNQKLMWSRETTPLNWARLAQSYARFWVADAWRGWGSVENPRVLDSQDGNLDATLKRFSRWIASSSPGLASKDSKALAWYIELFVHVKLVLKAYIPLVIRQSWQVHSSFYVCILELFKLSWASNF